MHRKPLLDSLEHLQSMSESVEIFAHFPEQREILNRFRDFVSAHEQCFERTLMPGHITGSAFVLSKDLKKGLLNYHAKIQKWLHLGGHADGHPAIHEVAYREAIEESGIADLKFFDLGMQRSSYPVPFDLDIHEFPATATAPAHWHYDVRFLLVAEGDETFSVSEESLALKWVELDQISSYTQELSMLRQVCKAKWFSLH